MYVQTYSKPCNNSFIFPKNISGLFHSPMHDFCSSYSPQGNTIVHFYQGKGHIVV